MTLASLPTETYMSLMSIFSCVVLKFGSLLGIADQIIMILQELLIVQLWPLIKS